MTYFVSIVCNHTSMLNLFIIIIIHHHPSSSIIIHHHPSSKKYSKEFHKTHNIQITNISSSKTVFQIWCVHWVWICSSTWNDQCQRTHSMVSIALGRAPNRSWCSAELWRWLVEVKMSDVVEIWVFEAVVGMKNECENRRVRYWKRSWCCCYCYCC